MPFFGPNIKKMKERGDIQGILQLLGNKNVETRIEAVRALSELKNIEGLIKALKNDMPEVRVEAISALKNFFEPKIIEAIIEHLVHEDADAVWDEAFNVLSELIHNDEQTWIKVGEDFLNIQYRGSLKCIEKAPEMALKCFEKAAEINPDKEVLFRIGEILRVHVMVEDALKYFEKMIRLDPDDARGWEGKGASLYGLDHNDEAITCCRKALEIEPHLAVARYTLCAIFLKKGNYDAVINLAQESLQIAPDDTRFILYLSEALLLLSRLSEAESNLLKALESLYQREYIEAEDLCMIHQQLGILYAMKGHKEKAIKHFKEAARANPRDQWSYKLLDAYLILDVLGKSMDGTPLERRARLIGLAEKRARTYSSLAEWEAAQVE